MGRSFKSNIDRNNLFDVPSYATLTKRIKGIKDKPWVQPACAIMVCCGCRVKELLYLKRGNIKFFDYINKEIPEDKLILSNVATVQLNFHTEKNRKSQHRVVPLIKNEVFVDMIEIIVDYCKKFKYDETLLFPYSRVSVWRATKRSVGKDFFPHYFRHANCTNDTRAGVSPVILKTKFGWSDLRPHSVYSHLNFLDVLNEQKKVFGEATKKEEIAEVIEKHADVRKEFVENSNNLATSQKVEDSKPIRIENEEHEEPVDPITEAKDTETLNKIAALMETLPKNPDIPEKKAPIPVDLDEETPPPVKREESKFVGPEIHKSPTKEFLSINPAGAQYFKSGTIVDNKVVITGTVPAEIEKIKAHNDPERVIPMLKPNPDTARKQEQARKNFGHNRVKEIKRINSEVIQVV